MQPDPAALKAELSAVAERDRPIGVFDSGLGGLTVLRSFLELLPHENLVYFGDNGRTPYGTKSCETVRAFSRQNMRFLLSRQVKMIVIACNTASSCAYEQVRDEAGVPVIEVVRPGSVQAAAQSRNGRIGVIGTRSTVESGVYIEALQETDPQAAVFQQACPLFVGLAEEGWWDLPVTREIARIYLEPLLAKEIDTLVLGCTHYPLLKSAIGAAAGPEVVLIDAGRAVAEEARRTLADAGLLRQSDTAGHVRFFTSDSAERFTHFGSAFLEQTIDYTERIDIETY